MLMFDSHWMPLATPGHRREHERDGEHRDDADQHRVAGLADARHDVQPAADLQRAEAQRGRGAEQRREDRQHVDDLAAIAPLARSPDAAARTPR